MENNPNDSLRRKAIFWWSNLNDIQKQCDYASKYIREGANPEKLTGREIQEIYEKEIKETSYAVDKEYNLKNFNSKGLFTTEEVIALLVKERERAVGIAYEFKEKFEQKYKDKVKAEESVYGKGSPKLKESLAFINQDIANECRIIGNCISGSNALSNDTLRDRIIKQYNF